ncbi:hypothetical protein ARAM_000387 [Aspergillus rambellii]|uniref:Cyclin-dependent protein n=1 Tax=Aspergillus rambellii TaxID=308745 RepID=A0A0F8XTC6_9EURO|nr:hypothetical protein ARAM_000387 [Aspergillus rambellii]
MLVSSPSPSAALRPSPRASGSSPSIPQPPLSPCSPFSRRLSSSTSAAAAAFAYHNQHYEPAANLATVPNTTTGHYTSHSSRIAIEELRSALKRHTVSRSPTVPSGDPPCGHMSAGQSSLGGGISAAPLVDPAAASVPESSSDPPTNNSFPPVSSDPPSAPPLTSSNSAPVSAPKQTSLATSSMPAPTTTTTTTTTSATSSASNKRNSPNGPVNSGATVGGLVGSDLEGSQSKRLRPAKPEVKNLPTRYELVDTRDLVVLISSMLMELIRFNDKIPLHQGRLTRFHSRTPPRISVQDYLQRLTTHATLSPPILLSMVYYIDRLCALYPAFTVSSLTIHRFLITSATVASKGLSDSFWTNKTYSRVGGISMNELALLELEFLFRVEWRIVPQPEVLDDYYQSLVERCEGFEIHADT